MKLGSYPMKAVEVTIVVCVLAVLTIPENPLLQFAWGFICGFSQAIFAH